MAESSLTGDDGAGERRPGFRAAGTSASRIVGPIVARHGGGILARLKSEWGAIVGQEIAVVTWPESLGRDGALKLRVAPTRALEIQHRAPQVIERINLFFGREAATRLALVQGPLPLAAPAPAPRAGAPVLDASEAAALDRRLEAVASLELRAALARLGRRVIAAAE